MELKTGLEFDGIPHERELIRTETVHYFLPKGIQSPAEDDLVIVKYGNDTLVSIRWGAMTYDES